jgi:predicted restriction endonuclease
MNRYRFIIEKLETPTSSTSTKIEVINYKCLICGTTFDWDDKWEEVRKLHIKEEVDQHHNDHIVP